MLGDKGVGTRRPGSATPRSRASPQRPRNDQRTAGMKIVGARGMHAQKAPSGKHGRLEGSLAEGARASTEASAAFRGAVGRGSAPKKERRVGFAGTALGEGDQSRWGLICSAGLVFDGR